MQNLLKSIKPIGFISLPLVRMNAAMQAQSGFLYSAIVTSLIIGIFLPLLYMFVMIEYGAITFPYWDHVPTAKYIIKYFDGTLTFHDLIEPHNEARPLFPRFIFVASAALTKWDLRAEYTYVYLTLYGTVAALLFALWRISRDWSHLAVLTTALVISVLACSPVGAMTQYWSLMLFASLSYFAAIIALLAVSLRPHAWNANIFAAVLAWVATYSVGQGLLVFPAILITHQMIAPRLFVLNRWSVFWLVNLVVCYTVYLSGSNINGKPQSALLDVLPFIPVYTGNPLGSLLWFPAMGVVWLPETSIINAICGAIILALTAFTVWHAWLKAPDKSPETVAFLSFAAYSSACAVVTAWGRANGPYAVATANSSRYSIFAATFLFALIFYYAPKFARRELAFTLWHKAALGFFLVASAVSYVRAVPVFSAAHDDNNWLANAYSRHAEPTAFDSRVFPSPSYFIPIRRDLLRLGIGPYRAIPEFVETIYDPKGYVGAEPLTPGANVKQRFHPSHPAIKAISFPVVTWAKVPSTYRVRWTAIGVTSGAKLGEGSFSTAGLTDWQSVTIKLNNLVESGEVEVSFFVDADAAVKNPLGLAFYKPGAEPSSVAIIGGKARNDGGNVGFTVHYEQ